MRAFTAAAVQVAPLPGPLTAESVKGNLAKAADWVDALRRGDRRRARRAARVGAPPASRPASARTSCGTWSTEVPGPVIEPLQEVARRLGVHVVVGTYERGRRARRRLQRRGAGRPRTARSLGVYRKTHPFCTEMRHRRRLGDARRRGLRRRDRPRPDRPDHLLRRRLSRAVPDHGGARRRGDRAAVRPAPLGRHLGAHQPGPGLRQPRLRRRAPTPPASTRRACSTSATR